MNRWTINEREKKERKTYKKLKLRSDVFLEKMAARLTFSIILDLGGRNSGEAWIKRHHNTTNSLEVANKEHIKGTAQ